MKMNIASLLRLLLILMLMTTLLSAQQSAAKPAQEPSQSATTADAAPADVDSPDHLIAAVYDVISGPKTKQRDWVKMRSLFYPGARLVAAGKRPTGEDAVRVFTVNEYAERTTPIFAQEGFFEKEAARRSETFGRIYHAWSTYESRHNPTEAPFARGINSIQLMNDGKRWWVLSILWDAERD